MTREQLRAILYRAYDAFADLREEANVYGGPACEAVEVDSALVAEHAARLDAALGELYAALGVPRVSRAAAEDVSLALVAHRRLVVSFGKQIDAPGSTNDRFRLGALQARWAAHSDFVSFLENILGRPECQGGDHAGTE